MKAVSERRRCPQQILVDGLYPCRDKPPDPELDDRRHQAIADVLCRLPEDVYERVKRIKQSNRSFEWFLPDISELGLVYPLLPNKRPRKMGGMPIPDAKHGLSILVPYARVIYLSPLLELRAWDSIVLVVAHRLMPFVWKSGVETVQCCQDERPGTACIEFAGSGDLEMFLNIAQRDYKAEVEQWDEGGDGRCSFRIRLLVFFPIGDVACLLQAFNEHNRPKDVEQGPASE
jgi:hypothetical protein